MAYKCGGDEARKVGFSPLRYVGRVAALDNVLLWKTTRVMPSPDAPGRRVTEPMARWRRVGQVLREGVSTVSRRRR